MPSAPVFSEIAPHLYEQSYPATVDDDALADFLAMLERRQPELERPHAWIADFSALRSANARKRRMFAEFQERTAPIDRAHNAGSALVVPNGLVRGLVTAVHWLQPPVYPTVVVASRAEALRWTQRQLADRGVDLH